MDIKKEAASIINASSLSKSDKNLYISHFKYAISTTGKEIKDMKQMPIGTSLLRGCPHLPKDFNWPDNYYFFAQFNCAQIKPIDALKLLPDSGMLWLFFNPADNDFRPVSKTAAKLLYFDGDMNKLEIRNPPPQAFYKSHPSYYKDLVSTSDKMEFTPGFTFGIEDVPLELCELLSNQLSLSYFENTDCGLYGFPRLWQGEGDEDGLFAPPDWDWITGPPPVQDNVLFFQDVFFDGNIHFWLTKEQMIKKDYAEVMVTASVT
ncbi:DUF1963 domain-containing protein [Chryseotalea sanaruensis]|nr:DUF1963 domain-containing protein [Chryseotalea sanaruensis]